LKNSKVVSFLSPFKVDQTGNLWTPPRKSKVHPRTGHEGPDGESRHNCTLPLTSAIDGVGGQPLVSAALYPWERPDTHVRKAGWAPGPVWTGAEDLAPPEFDPPTIQSVASRNTN